MVRSRSEAEAGSREREARGVASLSTQGWAPGFALRSAPEPPFKPEMLHPGRGEGAGAARSGWGSPHCAPRAAGAFPPPPRDG
ncbi:unnamed protein product [Rangifer tarandus platyrhynchus]|uniref:Uncharacterized protein n=2 Tax=Rangifer tarandus platyrhynchus TaxID=3082113 RepID=A0ABN8Y237_RANTA|nr:unnamed protein product [Rangifer tarandus platyrhynchus]CAI9692961.1 unnamed protein product [Rangifer tarandus platyrhynchus]